MKLKHHLGVLVVMVLGFIMANPSLASTLPLARGTFIQSWLVKDWTDDQWKKEMLALKAVGIDLIILQETADTQKNTAIYDTKLPGFTGRKASKDAVANCFRNAKKYGCRIMLGLNGNEDWWKYYSSKPEWLYSEMVKGNQIAAELNQRYVQQYPEQFFGWYLWWEIDNLNHPKMQNWMTLAKALDTTYSYLHQLTPGKPVMFSPFHNAKLGKPEDYYPLWKTVVLNSSMGKGDILCPQDCVGTGSCNVDNFTQWTKMYRKAVDLKPGLLLWSDMETFQPEYKSADINRIITQLTRVQPYVDDIVTFAYTHYQSPNQVKPGYHQEYLDYYQRTLKKTKP